LQQHFLFLLLVLGIFFICIDLYRLLTGKGSPKPVSFWHHAFAWGISTTGAAVPFVSNSFGHPDAGGVDCWYRSARDLNKIAILGPLIFYIFFAIFLIFVYYFRSRYHLWSNNKVQSQIRKHLLAFVLVFIVTWIWLIAAVLEDMISGETFFHWTDFFSYTGFKLSGFFNCIVWMKSPIFEFAKKNEKKEGEEDDSDEDGTSVSESTVQSELPVVRKIKLQPTKSEITPTPYRDPLPPSSFSSIQVGEASLVYIGTPLVPLLERDQDSEE